jgi:hypothetical protein
LRFQRFQADGSSTSSSTGVVVDGEVIWTDETALPEVPVRLLRREER